MMLYSTSSTIRMLTTGLLTWFYEHWLEGLNWLHCMLLKLLTDLRESSVLYFLIFLLDSRLKILDI